jgi:hypothetical protein
MTNPNDRVYPVPESDTHKMSLTKREYFAAMAMQGYCEFQNASEEVIAGWSVRMADALIAELNKPKPEAE